MDIIPVESSSLKRISRLYNSHHLKYDRGNRLRLARELGSALSCSAVAVGSLVACIMLREPSPTAQRVQ